MVTCLCRRHLSGWLPSTPGERGTHHHSARLPVLVLLSGWRYSSCSARLLKPPTAVDLLHAVAVAVIGKGLRIDAVADAGQPIFRVEGLRPFDGGFQA